PVALHIPLVGSYSSALVKAPIYPPATSTLPLGSNVAVCCMRAVLRLPVSLNVNGDPEAVKTAEIDSKAIERATCSVLPLVELFCCFFIDVFLLVFGCWAMFVVRHLFPETRDEVPENFSRGLKFSICAGQGYPEPGCDVWIGVRLPSRGSLLRILMTVAKKQLE